jgi:hypothetical protein
MRKIAFLLALAACDESGVTRSEDEVKKRAQGVSAKAKGGDGFSVLVKE